MKRFFVCCLLLTCVYLGGCASIVSSSSRNIAITTEPDQAQLEIVNIKDNNISILKSGTPHTLNLDASAGFFKFAEYRIKVSKDGYLPIERRLEGNINGWYFGNIIFGGVIGMLIVDPATGAMWKFSDDKINFKLYKDSSDGKIAMAKEVYSGVNPMEIRDFQQVIDDTSKGIALYPEFIEAYIRRCTAYEELGDKQKSEIDLQRVLELQPNDAKTLQSRGEFLVTKKMTDKALADFNKALELDPNQAESLFSRGQLYARNKEDDKARRDISAACNKGYSRACDYMF